MNGHRPTVDDLERTARTWNQCAWMSLAAGIGFVFLEHRVREHLLREQAAAAARNGDGHHDDHDDDLDHIEERVHQT